jgi:hypothetical protein
VAQPGAVLEVTNGQFIHGVAAVVGVQVDRAAVAVGDEGVVAPVRPQGGLGTNKLATAHDWPAWRTSPVSARVASSGW